MKKIMLCFLLCISLSAIGQTVMGARSCGKWVTARNASGFTADGQAMRSWLVGFVSGLNLMIYADKKIDLLERVESESIYLFADNYCKANPLADLDNAGFQLLLELMKKNIAK